MDFVWILIWSLTNEKTLFLNLVICLQKKYDFLNYKTKSEKESFFDNLKLLFYLSTFVSFSLFSSNKRLTLSIMKYKKVVHILIFLHNVNIGI